MLWLMSTGNSHQNGIYIQQWIFFEIHLALICATVSSLNCRKGKMKGLGENPCSKDRTKNRLNPHLMPGHHIGGQVSTLAIVPSLLLQRSQLQEYQSCVFEGGAGRSRQNTEKESVHKRANIRIMQRLEFLFALTSHYSPITP